MRELLHGLHLFYDNTFSRKLQCSFETNDIVHTRDFTYGAKNTNLKIIDRYQIFGKRRKKNSKRRMLKNVLIFKLAANII